jgi:hypothetical protein
MALFLVFLFPFTYFFSKISVPLFGTIDQLFVVAGAYFLFFERTVNQKKSIAIDPNIIVVYLLYCISSCLSLFNNQASDLINIYHAFTILAKPGIAILVFYAIASLKNLRYCIWLMLSFLLAIILTTIYLAYNYQSFLFLRNEIAIKQGFFQYTILSNPNVLTRAVILILPIVYVYSFYLKNRSLVLGIRLVCLLCFLLPIMGISRATLASMTMMMMVIFWKLRQKFMILDYAAEKNGK